MQRLRLIAFVTALATTVVLLVALSLYVSSEHRRVQPKPASATTESSDVFDTRELGADDRATQISTTQESTPEDASKAVTDITDGSPIAERDVYSMPQEAVLPLSEPAAPLRTDEAVASVPAPTTSKPTSKAPTPVQRSQPSNSGDRLIIRQIGVNAPLSFKSVSKDGRMPDPDGEDAVVLYNFSALAGLGGTPGKGGNAVFAGHMDSGSKSCDYGTVAPPCPAVLWDLNKLGVGDGVQIQLSGTLYCYKVTSTESVPQNARWDKIVASTTKESITLLTCGGDFNRQTRTYDRRQVVKAVRI